jgi:c-di-GMP-related signal transduction protein
MLNSNINRGVLEHGGTVVKVSNAVQMAAYDQLPDKWKHLVDNLPAQQNVETILKIYQNQGDKGYQVVLDRFRQAFPNWSLKEPINS